VGWGPVFISLGGPLQETKALVHYRSKREASLSFLFNHPECKKTVISNPGESDINDDDLCDISPNFIAKAADLSHYCSPLLSFEDVFAQEEALTSFDDVPL
jgi:hypothetical protein